MTPAPPNCTPRRGAALPAACLPAGRARLLVSVQVPARLRPLQRLALRVVVSNTGRAAARAVVVRSGIPRLARALALRGARVRGSQFVWRIPRLAVGARRTLTVPLRVRPRARGRLVATARATAANSRPAVAAPRPARIR